MYVCMYKLLMYDVCVHVCMRVCMYVYVYVCIMLCMYNVIYVDISCAFQKLVFDWFSVSNVNNESEIAITHVYNNSGVLLFWHEVAR